MRWIAIGVSISLLGATTSFADEGEKKEKERRVQSFAELRDHLRVGDKVQIRSADREIVKGEIEGFDWEGQSLTLGDVSLSNKDVRYNRERWQGADDRTFTKDDIRRLELEVRDSLTSGTLIGLGAGASFGFLAAAGAGYDAATSLVAAALYGGIGAAIGAGLDAVNKKRIVLYERTGVRSTLELDVAPVLTKDRTGVQLSLRF